MKTEFENSVQQLDAQRGAPRETALRELAPVKKELLQLAAEYAARAARVRPLAAEVQGQVTVAVNRGLGVPLDVSQHLREAFGDGQLPGLLDGASATCRLRAEEIDRLSADDIYNNQLPRLSSHARTARGLGAALDKLEAALKRDRETMLELVRRAAGLPSPPSVVERPGSPSILDHAKPAEKDGIPRPPRMGP
jgi:hypothetical protein